MTANTKRLTDLAGDDAAAVGDLAVANGAAAVDLSNVAAADLLAACLAAGLRQRIDTPIVAAGDSLTGGSGGTPYPTLLATLTGRTVTNLGIGGQTSAQIAARTGGAPAGFTVTGNSIPTSGTVSVTARTVSPLTDQGAQLLVGTLAGRFGTLNRAPDDSYGFDPAPPAYAALACPAGTPFVPYLGALYQDDIWSIWAGRNDDLSTLLTTTADNVAAMAAYARGGKYIVIGITTKSDGTENSGSTPYGQIAAYNNARAAEYGGRFLDIRRYLIDFGLASQGLTPTTADNTAIAADTIPPQLMAGDLEHLNTIGYTIVAQRVQAIIDANGW